MKKMKRNKIALFISQQGDGGKTHNALNVIDQARILGIETAGYLADIKASALMKKLGERTVDGELIEQEEQDHLKGIKIIDIANQMNGSHQYIEGEKLKLFRAFEDNIPLTVIDFPGQGDSSFKQHFGADELETSIETSNKDFLVVIPISNRKSLDSIGFLRETFTFTGEYEFLNEQITFVIAHNPISNNTDLDYEAYLQTKEHADLLQLGDRYKHYNILTINKEILNRIEDKPYSYYFNIEGRGSLINERIPSWVQDGTIPKTEFLIQLRRLFNNETGFYQITKKYFIGE